MDGLPYSRSSDIPSVESPTGIERRMVYRLLSYWRTLSVDDEIPLLDSVDPEAIPDIWECSFVLDVSGHQHDPVIRFLGPKIGVHSDMTLVGTAISNVPKRTLLSMAVSYVPEVLRKEIPICRGGEFVRVDGSRLLYRSIVLPMSTNGRSVNFLLGCANYRIVTGE